MRKSLIAGLLPSLGVCVSGIERCRKWMYSPPLRSNCAILRPLSPACAKIWRAPALRDCGPNAPQQGSTGFAAVSAVVTDDTDEARRAT
jgi:hypothetical protein